MSKKKKIKKVKGVQGMTWEVDLQASHAYAPMCIHMHLRTYTKYNKKYK